MSQFCNSLKKKLKLFLLKNLIYLGFKCCRVKKVTLSDSQLLLTIKTE